MPSMLPEPREKANPEKLSHFDRRVIGLLLNGYSQRDIVLHLAKGKPGDRQRIMKRYRRLVRRAVSRSEQFHMDQRNQSLGSLWLALPDITDALIRRAKRGRPDAIKLAWEAMGFYNPKVKHEHSGDIEIRLTLPRPERTGISGPTIEGQAEDIS